jgi:hypothetical protein
MLLTACILALVFLFVLILYALRRKRYVRAAFKGLSLSFEFEADDGRRDKGHSES